MNISLEQIIKFLQSYGFHLEIVYNDSNYSILMFSLSIFTLAFISLICVVNISLYLLVLHFSEHKKVIEVVSKQKLPLKLFNLYKKTRQMFLVSELVLLTMCTSSIVYICRIVFISFCKTSLSKI